MIPKKKEKIMNKKRDGKKEEKGRAGGKG